MSGLQDFVLGLLKATGTPAEQTSDGHGISFRVRELTTDLQTFFQRQKNLYFTFDPDYYELYAAQGVEFIALGTPILDRLIRYAKTRFLISEGVAVGVPQQRLNVQSASLKMQSQASKSYNTYLCFHLKVAFISEEQHDEFIQVWVDSSNARIVSPPKNFQVLPSQVVSVIPTEIVQAAWNLAWQDAEAVISEKLDQFEEIANKRLDHELSRMKNAGLRQSEQQRLIDRSKLTVQNELIFVEIVQYPLQIWDSIFQARTWSSKHRYQWDEVARSWSNPPICPICRQKTFQLESCDAGQHIVCPNCVGKCSTCDSQHCTRHPTIPCHHCLEGQCKNCLKICNSCGTQNCQQCQTSCSECTARLCLECSVSCSACDKKGCPEHFKVCHITNDVLCVNHALSCANCQRTTRADHLHPVRGRGLLCDDCVVTCAAPHREPVWLAALDAVFCADSHDKPHALCQEHQCRCDLHHEKAYFCSQHIVNCRSCNAAVCSKHRQVSALSQEIFCNAHIDTCSRCQRAFGATERRRVARGTSVCRECTGQCASCTDQDLHWNLNDLAACPHCIKLESQFGNLQKQSTPSNLLRFNPQISYCPEHRFVCHICQRPACEKHATKCAECQKPTCMEDVVKTVDGALVCKACVQTCRACPPNTFHLTRTLTRSERSRDFVCATHLRQCDSCLAKVSYQELQTTKKNQQVCAKCVYICHDCPPHIRHSINDVQPCHCSKGKFCSQHSKNCDSCQKPTRTSLLKKAVSGEYVCPNCAKSCAICSSEKIYTANHIFTCAVSQTVVCQAHLSSCDYCERPVSLAHVHDCLVCGDRVCSSCSQNQKCLTCQNIAPTPNLAIEKLPLSAAAQNWSVYSSQRACQDGTIRRYIFYYPQTTKISQLLLFFIDSASVEMRLDVLVQRSGRFTLIKSKSVKSNLIGVPTYSILKEATWRLRGKTHD